MLISQQAPKFLIDVTVGTRAHGMDELPDSPEDGLWHTARLTCMRVTPGKGNRHNDDPTIAVRKRSNTGAYISVMTLRPA